MTEKISYSKYADKIRKGTIFVSKFFMRNTKIRLQYTKNFHNTYFCYFLIFIYEEKSNRPQVITQFRTIWIKQKKVEMKT